MKFRSFLANIICGIIPFKKTRDIVRIKIKYYEYVTYCKQFAMAHTCGTHHKIKINVGARSHNLIILVDNLYAFKFPLHDNGYAKAIREKRIVDSLSKISPIKIPKMRIYQWGDITVRKYEFSNGLLLKDLTPQTVINNKTKIASQLAQFIYSVGISDPKEICDLKPDSNAKPGFLHGWFHNDIAENFTLNPETCDITGFIDWEDADFVDFDSGLTYAKENWDKCGFYGLMDDVMNTYSSLYQKSGKTY